MVVNPYQTQGDLYVAVDALIKYGRPRAALGCLARVVQAQQPLDAKRAVDVLRAAVSSDEPMRAFDPYDAGVVITVLQNDSNAKAEDLLAVEWAYLPLLNEHNDTAPRTLNAQLASDPRFYSEIIRMVFRSKSASGEPADAEPAEERKARAENAYQLLEQWRTIPGTAVGGELSGDAFIRWMDEVRGSTEESGHLEIALQKAGEVLIHSPPDPDGLWIHRAVAEVLNRQDMGELRAGYGIGVYNSRGMHFIDPTGAPEKELAARYQRRAEEIENAGFHRFAATLRDISQNYQRESEQVVARSRHEAAEDSG